MRIELATYDRFRSPDFTALYPVEPEDGDSDGWCDPSDSVLSPREAAWVWTAVRAVAEQATTPGFGFDWLCNFVEPCRRLAVSDECLGRLQQSFCDMRDLIALGMPIPTCTGDAIALATAIGHEADEEPSRRLDSSWLVELPETWRDMPDGFVDVDHIEDALLFDHDIAFLFDESLQRPPSLTGNRLRRLDPDAWFLPSSYRTAQVDNLLAEYRRRVARGEK